MNISDLIGRVGENKVRNQTLTDALVHIQTTKGGSLVTFGTDALTPADLIEPRFVGIVFWFPREDFERVMAEVEAEGK